MEDAYGVPRSPISFVDEELERQQHRQQPVPNAHAQAEELCSESGSEEEYLCDPELVEEGVALAEATAIASGSAAVGSSSDADGNLSKYWHHNTRQNRKRSKQVGANQQRKAPRAAVSEAGYAPDDLVEHIGAAFHAEFSNHDASVDGDSDDTGNADAAATGPVAYVDARCMTGFDPHHFGRSITAKIPEFRHGTWISYADAKAEVNGMTPVRALCWNVPAELFSFDSTRFRHWTTPACNPARATNIASILSFCFTGTSKGFL